MRRSVGVWCAVLLAACGGGAGSSDGGAAFRPLDVGMPVPPYAVASLQGDTVRMGAVGDGAEPVTLLNVWATWCTSCSEEMETLDSLQHEFGARGLRVVGVSVDEGPPDRIRRYAESHQLRFSVAHDPAGTIQRRYQLVAVPTTFLVGGDGRLLWRHTGNINAVVDSVRAAIEPALAAR